VLIKWREDKAAEVLAKRPKLSEKELAKMKEPGKGASRIAIIFNGSPLSNGDCGSGESEVRRWILENDWLDAIVMLPDQLFYNTGIFTYVWLLRNDKPASHKGRVMLIDARRQYEKEPKSFGDKRNRITDATAPGSRSATGTAGRRATCLPRRARRRQAPTSR
jgi:type I restriction-modification system DNA methylase subunit